jgi:hypothetical protein
MSTLGALTKSAAAVAIGAAALLSAPAVVSAAPFMPDPLANCNAEASFDVERDEDTQKIEWEFDGPTDATTDAQVTYLNIGQAGPTIGSSGPLVNDKDAERDLPGFTAHLIPGGTYDPDGTKGQAATCALGFGFAVTQ